MPKIDLKKAEIQFQDGAVPTPRQLEIVIGEGNLTYGESRNIDYVRDKGALDLVREGEDEPVEVSFDFVWSFLRTQTGDIVPTPEEVLKQIGLASIWDSTGPECEPYSINIVIIYDPQCVGVETETIVLTDFRYEDIDYDIRDGSINCTGKCNVTEADVYRGLTPPSPVVIDPVDAIVINPIACDAVLTPLDITGLYRAVYNSCLFSTGVTGATINVTPTPPTQLPYVQVGLAETDHSEIILEDPIILQNSTVGSYDGIWEIDEINQSGSNYYSFDETPNGAATADFIPAKFLFGIEPSQVDQVINLVVNNLIKYSPVSPITPFSEVYRGVIIEDQDTVQYAREIIASNSFSNAGLYWIKIGAVYWFILGGGHQSSPTPATCRAIVDMTVLSREQYAVHHGNPWA